MDGLNARRRRHPLILDGLCLHVLSSFQRTGVVRFRSTAPPVGSAVLRGTFQLYDNLWGLSTLKSTFLQVFLRAGAADSKLEGARRRSRRSFPTESLVTEDEASRIERWSLTSGDCCQSLASQDLTRY